MRPPLPARGPLDFEHPLAARGEEARETGAIRARALERPRAPAWCMPSCQSQRLPVAAPAGGDRQAAAQLLRLGLDQSEGVSLGVRVDAEHKGDVLCKHGEHLQRWGNVVPVVTERAAARLG